jgi:hypothetical protein
VTTYGIPQFTFKAAPIVAPVGLGRSPKRDYVPNFRERSASKKVDDLSRHESKHDTDPKHDPKHNLREKATDGTKPGTGQPQPGLPAPGTGKH